jgi:predicted O-methyltransferase YrrM
VNTIAEFKARAEACGGTGLFRRCALSIRDGAGVFEKLLGDRRYRTVLEIGTYRGVTAAYMSQFCDRVITIDLKNGRMERQSDPFDRKGFWRQLGIGNIELHLVRSNAEKASIVAGLDFDFAFVDGDHTPPGPAEDFAMVRKCGAVLFHDYDGQNGVVDLVNSLPSHQVEVMDIFAFWRG